MISYRTIQIQVGVNIDASVDVDVVANVDDNDNLVERFQVYCCCITPGKKQQSQNVIARPEISALTRFLIPSLIALPPPSYRTITASRYGATRLDGHLLHGRCEMRVLFQIPDLYLGAEVIWYRWSLLVISRNI